MKATGTWPPDVAAQFVALASEAMVGISPAGEITAWNTAAGALLGRDAAAAIGRPWRECVPLGEDAAAPARAEWLDASGVARRPATIRRADGSALAVEVTVAPAAPAGTGWLLLLADVGARVAAEERALASERRATMVMEELPAAFGLVELASGRYEAVYQNKYGEVLTGWSNAEWERDPDFTLTLLHPDDREHALAVRAELRATPRSYVYDYRIRRPNGGYVWLRDHGKTVNDAAGNPEYWIGFIIDVTEQREAELALRDAMAQVQAANDELQRVSVAKSAYLSMMSHEFRTPLTTILGFSELIAAGDLTPAESMQFADLIAASSRRLSRLINDTLDLDRIEAGQTNARPRRVALAPMIAEVVRSLSRLSERHALVTALAPELPPVLVDPDLMTQVLTNVIANAIKYSPAGGQVTIAARGDGEVVELRVTDAGPGIPADALETIFSRFSRLDRTLERSVPGSGLGLTIAREIVDRHGGRIWAESPPGAGATFVIRLPVAG